MRKHHNPLHVTQIDYDFPKTITCNENTITCNQKVITCNGEKAITCKQRVITCNGFWFVCHG